MFRRFYFFVKSKIKTSSRKFKKLVPIKIPVFQSDLLNGRTALITGSNSGIGKAIAEAFLKSGSNVILTGRNFKKLNELKDLFIKNYGEDCEKKIETAILDISKTNDIENQFLKISSSSKFTVIDIFVNNAAINIGSGFGQTKPEDFSSVIQTNLEGTYFASQIFAKYMKEKKIQGNILNIASSSSNRPAISAYACSKWALKGLTQGMAKSLIPYGIVVNALAPGPTATPMLIKDGYEGIELLGNPSGRYACPEEIANMAVILVSTMGRMIVGDTIMMTGGAGIITFDDMKYDF